MTRHLHIPDPVMLTGLEICTSLDNQYLSWPHPAVLKHMLTFHAIDSFFTMQQEIAFKENKKKSIEVLQRKTSTALV